MMRWIICSIPSVLIAWASLCSSTATYAKAGQQDKGITVTAAAEGRTPNAKNLDAWAASLGRATERLGRISKTLVSIAADKARGPEERRKAILLLGKSGDARSINFLIANASLRLPMGDIMTAEDWAKRYPCRYALARSRWRAAEGVLDALARRPGKQDAENLLLALRVILGKRLMEAARTHVGTRTAALKGAAGSVRAEGGELRLQAKPEVDAARPQTWQGALDRVHDEFRRVANLLIATAKDEGRERDERSAAIQLLGGIGNKESLGFLAANISLRLPGGKSGVNGKGQTELPCRDALLKSNWNSAHAILKALNRRRPGEDLIHCAKVLGAILGTELAIAALDAVDTGPPYDGIWRRNLNAVKSYLTQ